MKLIGQGVSELDFFPTSRTFTDKVNFLHVGRLDPAKNIHLIIEELMYQRMTSPDLQLRFIGVPSTQIAQEYFQKILGKYKEEIQKGWLRFEGPKKRTELLEVLQNSDVFIHAFHGSLDKTLVEATMVKLPVVTVNESYIHEFGSWVEGAEEVNLRRELAEFMAATPDKIKRMTENRFSLAKSGHTLVSWSNKIASAFGIEP